MTEALVAQNVEADVARTIAERLQHAEQVEGAVLTRVTPPPDVDAHLEYDLVGALAAKVLLPIGELAGRPLLALRRLTSDDDDAGSPPGDTGHPSPSANGPASPSLAGPPIGAAEPSDPSTDGPTAVESDGSRPDPLVEALERVVAFDPEGLDSQHLLKAFFDMRKDARAALAAGGAVATYRRAALVEAIHRLLLPTPSWSTSVLQRELRRYRVTELAHLDVPDLERVLRHITEAVRARNRLTESRR